MRVDRNCSKKVNKVVSAMPGREPTRCLFIKEIPAHYTTENVGRIFSGEAGYETCRVRVDAKGSTTAFVDFATVPDSVAARQQVHGQVFDGVQFQLQFARDMSRKSRGSSGKAGASAAGGESRGSSEGRGSAGAGRSQPRGGGGLVGGFPSHPNNVTLFVEGVPANATEREIGHIFRPFEGFVTLRLKMPRRLRPGPVEFTMCFVEFVSREAAQACMDVRKVAHCLSHAQGSSAVASRSQLNVFSVRVPFGMTSSTRDST